jgi:hypothetical protein
MATRTDPFIMVSWSFVVFGWILMLAAAAALQQVRLQQLRLCFTVLSAARASSSDDPGG